MGATGGIGEKRERPLHDVGAPHDEAGRLLIQASTGDTEAFQRFYQLNVDDVTRYVASRSSSSDVEDLVADTFVLAFHKAASFRDQGRPAKAWLITIAKNRLVSHHRSRRRRASLNADELTVPSVEERTIERDQGLGVMGHVSRLPANQQEVLRLRFVDELSVSACASALGVSEGAVRASTFRALSALRRRVDLQ